MRIKQHVKSVISISGLVLVVLFKFQNCGPAPQMSATDPVANIGPNEGEVRIVDRWSEEKVIFLAPTQKVATQQPVNVQGLCVGSEKGQKIQYQVLEINDIPKIVYVGEVECVMGGFEVPVGAVNFHSCNDKLQIRAARTGDSSEAAETILQPDC